MITLHAWLRPNTQHPDAGGNDPKAGRTICSVSLDGKKYSATHDDPLQAVWKLENDLHKLMIGPRTAVDHINLVVDRA